jgi:hypothetical protein
VASAETKDHLNWELLGEVARDLKGAAIGAARAKNARKSMAKSRKSAEQ